MMKTRLAIVALVAAGLAGSTFAVEAKTHKTTTHKSMSRHSSTTTGANMKSNTRSGTAANPSSQGNVGPGTNNAGSTGK
jgi:hypothetical protein